MDIVYQAEMLNHLVKFAVESAFPQQSKFYVDDDDDCVEEEEFLFCKNNVCVHSPTERDKIAGYFTIKSRTRKSGHIRLIVSWTPNSQLVNIRENTGSKSTKEPNTLEVFCVDLSEMKTLKLFYDENDKTCGHLIIGNHENHYKVLHFHCGGLDKVTRILEEWDWCVSQKMLGDGRRRRCFLVTRSVPVKEDCYVEEGRFDPMPYDVWKTLFNDGGQIEDVTNFRRAVFFGGLSPEARKEAWQFLLFYYAFNSTYEERMHWKSKKEYDYLALQRQRLCMNEEEQDQFWKSVQCTVDKDVPRTDRSHPYFAGNGNPNTEIMRNILLNYAVHNPTVGYNQGMSDLLAPVLAVVQDEVDAFWCFTGLMEVSVFVTSPKDDVMDRQLVYLRELVKLLEPRFYAHLLIKDGGLDMLFCHRWLLLCFKREFFNAEVLLMWEACWSRYQTEYFHIFLCVAMIQEYGEEVIQQDMQSDDMLQYFTDLSMKMDGSKVLRKARQLLLKFRQLPFIPCSLRGLLSGPGIWDSAPLPSIECHCHGLCSSTRRNSGSLTDSDVDIMMKSKEKVDRVKEEKLERQETPNEVSSLSINDHYCCVKDCDVNVTEKGASRGEENKAANEEIHPSNHSTRCRTDDSANRNSTVNEREPEREKPENESIPKEEMSSPTGNQSSSSKDANGMENSDRHLGTEEKSEDQEIGEETLQSFTSQSNTVTNSDAKNKDMTEEEPEIESISKEELSQSGSKQIDDYVVVNKEAILITDTEELLSNIKQSNSTPDTEVNPGSDRKENGGYQDGLVSSSKQPSCVARGHMPHRRTENGSSHEDYVGETTAKEVNENDTKQDTIEEKGMTHDKHTKPLKNLTESSKASIIEVEGTAELASESIDDCQS